jgi:hypothetical protein
MHIAPTLLPLRSIDKSGNSYVSTLEARKYPIVAVQVRARL